MRKALYKLINRKTGKTLFIGTYKECVEKSRYAIEYVGEETPVYVATTNDNKFVGTMDELSKVFHCSKINLYNYTRYQRKSDGLFLRREA